MTVTPQLDELVELFYEDSEQLASFTPCSHQDCPPDYRLLLAHQSHMTVTVEDYYGELVEVQVLRDVLDNQSYQREILLRKQSDHQVVQYGIVRMKLDKVAAPVAEKILAKRTPLGRILIEHDLMRQVQLSALWTVRCQKRLAEFFDVPIGTTTYGRTALILLDLEPAIELLEIVRPVSLRELQS